MNAEYRGISNFIWVAICFLSGHKQIEQWKKDQSVLKAFRNNQAFWARYTLFPNNDFSCASGHDKTDICKKSHIRKKSLPYEPLEPITSDK